ncbi:hypothetical protein WDU94_004200 [Cyamophila willieti]
MESNIEPGMTNNKRANIPPKGKKRKKPIKDQSAPRQPLSGYFRFLNDRRDKVRAENPNITFQDLNKVLATEWKNLPQPQKQQYLAAAEQDRERYLQEFEAYKQTEAYKSFNASKKLKQTPISSEKEEVNFLDIPIFTEEFLEHNKSRETELRQLRKSIIDYEQQNAILSKHIETVKQVIAKLTTENNHQEATRNSLANHLSQIQSLLVANFAGLPLPSGEKATSENIEEYMTKALGYLIANPNSSFATTVKSIVSKLQYPD